MRGRDCTDQIDGECMNLAEELQCVELRDGNSEELREGDCMRRVEVREGIAKLRKGNSVAVRVRGKGTAIVREDN